MSQKKEIQKQEEKEKKSQEGKTQKKKKKEGARKKYKCTSHMIEVFEHEGKRYTIYPNAIVENLPENASQVQRLIKAGKLIEIE